MFTLNSDYLFYRLIIQIQIRSLEFLKSDLRREKMNGYTINTKNIFIFLTKHLFFLDST